MPGFDITSAAEVFRRKYAKGIERLVQVESLMSQFRLSTEKIQNNRIYKKFAVNQSGGVAYNTAGNVPGSIEPSYVEGSIDLNRRLYGVARFDGLMIHVSSQDSTGFASAVDEGMMMLKDQLTLLVNDTVVSGGQVCGFIHEHKAHGGTTSGAGQKTQLENTDNPGTATWQYRGSYRTMNGTAVKNDGTNFAAVATGDENTWLRVSLVRLDTYDTIAFTGGQANNNLFVRAIDEAAGTITLTVTANGAGASFTTAGVTDGYLIAVLLHDTVAIDNAGLQICRIYDFSHEPYGIFHWLANPSYWDVNRSNAAPTKQGCQRLQAWMFTAANSGTHAATTFAINRFNELKTYITAGDPLRPNTTKHFPRPWKISEYWCHPQFVNVYTQALTAVTQNHDVDGAPKSADMAFSKVTLDGKTFTVSPYFPNGMLFLRAPKTWSRAVLRKGAFDPSGGGILKPLLINGTDAHAAYWIEYSNTLCDEAYCNGLVSGYVLK